MTATTATIETRPDSTWLQRRVRALRVAAPIALLGLLPLMVISTMLWLEGRRDLVAEDFRLQSLPAAHAVLRGHSPYPDVHDLVATSAAYVYPAPAVVASLPLAALPDDVAAWLWTALLIPLIPLTLYVLNIRDWRCYGAALLWAPVGSALQTGNLTLPLAVCAALAWRYRRSRSGVPVAFASALKLFTWPLSVWLLATRRTAQAVVSVVGAAIVMLVAWGAIGFAGLADYPALARRLNELQAPHSYTLYAFGRELGLSSAGATVAWLVVGMGALAACIEYGRRGDDRRSFVLAIVAGMALSPIVWLHYFALLLVPMAVSRPRFEPIWLLPVTLWAVPADGADRAAWQTALGLAVFAVICGFCLRDRRGTEPAPMAVPA